MLEERDSSDEFIKLFAYGNYIDELLLSLEVPSPGYPLSPTYLRTYVHDHLYSPVAFLHGITGSCYERYEYDVYGNPHIMSASYEPRETSNYNNFYLFTGRRVDILDNGSLKIQYNRNRYLDYYTGRWLSHDPLGYVDGMSLYEYAKSNPILLTDALGGCSKPKPKYGTCKCFCITNFSFTGKQSKPYEQPFIGAHLTLSIQGKWVDWPEPVDQEGKGKPSEGATVEWWEWYDPEPTLNPELYVDTNPREWNRIIPPKDSEETWQIPDSIKDTSWSYKDHPHIEPGIGKFYVEDKFGVRAKNPEGCPCAQKEWFKAYGYLYIKGERHYGGIEVEKHIFRHSIPDGDYPPW